MSDTTRDGNAAKATHFPIVGVGASAGGLEALREMLSAMPRLPGMAFIVVQHLDPNHESMMAQLIERYCPLPVRQIEGGEKVACNEVYIIPPGYGLELQNRVLKLIEFRDPRGMRRPIDDFFESLASDQRAHSACVILSGTGADGSRGLRAIKEEGGVCVVQEPDTARYDGMPLSAVGTGLVDYIEEPEDIVSNLAAFFERRFGDASAERDASVVANHIDEMCSALREVVGHDFNGYKRATLARRIERRMQVLDITDAGEYLARIKSDGDECQALFRDLLINVTRFYRDPDAFESLREHVIDPMVRDAQTDQEIRVWIPGCSSGEEAYTLAMMFADACERLDRRPILQIFATDIDEQMLSAARESRYPAASLIDIPEPMRSNYTVGHGETFTIAAAIRDMVRFSSHSVVKDPPFSKIDLISCRNLLIYFDDRLQQAVLPVFHYSLRPEGYLFLGTSETVGRFDDLFDDIDQRSRIFRRNSRAPNYPLELPMTTPRRDRRAKPIRARETTPEWVEGEAVRKLTQSYSPASLLVDDEGKILSNWGPVGRYFDFPAEQSRRMIAQALAKQGLREKLGGLIRQTAKNSRRAIARDIEVTGDYGVQPVAVVCEPVGDGTYLVIVRDTGSFETFEDGVFDELSESDDRVDLLEDELRATRHRLRSTVEELETANEELKSSNEEMMSMNEELQSTNEELTTVNDELKVKIDQLTIANADLRNFFDSTQLAVIVVEEDLAIRSFTEAAKTLFPLQPSDRGRSLDEMSTLLADRRYIGLTRDVVASGQISEDRMASADGAADYALRIIPYRRLDGAIEGATLVFTDITKPLSLEKELKQERERLQLALRVAGIGVWEYDPDRGDLLVDAIGQGLLGVSESTISVETLLDRIHSEDRGTVRLGLARAASGEADYEATFRIRRADSEVDGKCDGSDDDYRWLNSLALRREGDEGPVVGVNSDLSTEQKMLHTRELLLREMDHRIKNLFAVVGGIISISARDATNLESFVEDLRQRVGAMDRAHSLTRQRGEQDPITLSELIGAVVAPTFRNGERIDFDGPPTAVPVAKVTPLALILHEWSTNAVKYGAFAHTDGKLTISWTRDGENTRIDWMETVPDEATAGKAGFGTRLIEATVRQLEATLEGEMEDGVFRRSLLLGGLPRIA